MYNGVQIASLNQIYAQGTNTNIDEVISLPTARHHKQNLMKIDTYRFDFRVLEKTNNVFIRDRFGFVVYVTVKMNLVNNPNVAMFLYANFLC